MKYTALGAFEKHLQAASPHNFADVYLLMSEDPYRRKQGLEKLTSLVLQGKPPSHLTYQAFDGERMSATTLMAELNALGFLAAKRLVVVSAAEALDKAVSTALEGYLTSPNRSVCLVLVSSGLHRGSSFYKKLEKQGIVMDLPEEKSWEKEKSVIEWLMNQAHAQGKQLIPRAATAMVKRMGTDQMLLEQELNKLICYVGKGTAIQEADVGAICSCSDQENTWQLGEAIFNREGSAAVRIARSQLNQETPLIALLRQLRSQFQTEFQVCTLLKQGGGAAEIAHEFPYMRGAILERHMKQAQHYGLDRFRKGLLAIDEAEMEAKNSALDPEFILDVLMVKLTT